MTIKLYGFGRSPNVRKVSLLAAALDIPLTHVTLDFNKREFHSPEYLAKNPNGKIPTIDDDGFILWESAAILRYLAAAAALSRRPRADRRVVPRRDPAARGVAARRAQRAPVCGTGAFGGWRSRSTVRPSAASSS